MNETVVESERETRARRILDVTADLVRRWGYKRTTIDDVARAAGIGKGTVYLHYKTRLALFEAVLLRESLRHVDELLTWLPQDPANALMHRYFAHAFRLIVGNPLLRAMFTADVEVLGELARRPEQRVIQERKIELSRRQMTVLRDWGLVHADMPVDQQLYAIQCTVMGFLFGNPNPALDYEPTLDEQAECLAHVIRGSFEPADAAAHPRLAEVSREVIGILGEFRDELADFLRQP
ncbi:TetR/AcrR family transcriptional regulator [Actinokineospora iranica]|uniref:DNA-binding transcriptional regulator, AcrR family n=1 Tax=Actinokineospora iranica TaxID=1271860 RepID=A0A1G6ZG11_9PSEU|nr:TetR/AcrR family transcriptional regulator [Actinokineospora iranica]SDE01500.1 DNA-binding transcriptional regulator, AcrR family [Actinokineospora iranica]